MFKVLIVDDDKIGLERQSHIIEEMNHTVLQARDKDSALELLNNNDGVACAVIDQKLGRSKTGGFELLAMIQEHWPRIPVVICTGSSANYARQAIELGAFLFLEKEQVYKAEFFTSVIMSAIRTYKAENESKIVNELLDAFSRNSTVELVNNQKLQPYQQERPLSQKKTDIAMNAMFTNQVVTEMEGHNILVATPVQINGQPHAIVESHDLGRYENTKNASLELHSRELEDFDSCLERTVSLIVSNSVFRRARAYRLESRDDGPVFTGVACAGMPANFSMPSGQSLVPEPEIYGRLSRADGSIIFDANSDISVSETGKDYLRYVNSLTKVPRDSQFALSRLWIPVKAHGKLVALLTVDNEDSSITGFDIFIGDWLMHHVNYLMEEIADKASRLESDNWLRQFEKVLNTAESLPDFMNKAVGNLREAFPNTFPQIYRLNEADDTTSLKLKAASNLTHDCQFSKVGIPKGVGRNWDVINAPSAGIMCIDNISLDDGIQSCTEWAKRVVQSCCVCANTCPSFPNHVVSAAIAPLNFGGETLGTLYLPCNKPWEFSQEEKSRVGRVSDIIAVTLSVISKIAILEEVIMLALYNEGYENLSAAFAHETRGPLGSLLSKARTLKTAVKINMRLAESKVVGELKLKQYVEMMETDALSLKQFVNDISSRRPEKQEVCLQDLLKNIVERSSKEVALAAINVKYVETENVPNGMVDVVRTQIIIRNIVKNAIEAVGRKCREKEVRGGSGSALQKQLVEITGRWKENELTLIVEDTGEGMKKEDLKKIFVPGYHKKAPGGNRGYGMFLVQMYIGDLDASIDISSTHGIGTRCEIQIPWRLLN